MVGVSNGCEFCELGRLAHANAVRRRDDDIVHDLDAIPDRELRARMNVNNGADANVDIVAYANPPSGWMAQHSP